MVTVALRVGERAYSTQMAILTLSESRDILRFADSYPRWESIIFVIITKIKNVKIHLYLNDFLFYAQNYSVESILFVKSYKIVE